MNELQEFKIMESLTLERVLYLLSFNFKSNKSASQEVALKLRKDFALIHTHFITNEAYTDKLRLCITGKCCSNIDSITRHFNLEPLDPPLITNTIFIKDKYKKKNKRTKRS